MVSAMILLSSCLDGDNEDNTTYYDDTAISAFSLGTLAIRLHTTASDGVTDSTYYSTVTGSNYKFYIDQAAAAIYNPDSLPAGTDPSHVLATITTLNSGTAILNLRSQDGRDSLAYYSSSDSIDFTDPVRIRVYNMRATAYREYTATVNVHREKPDSFAWRATAVEGLEGVTGRRLVATNGRTMLLGRRDGAPVAFEKADGGEWTETAASPATDSTLLGGSENSSYALRDGAIWRSTGGGEWVRDSLDDSADNLPGGAASLIVKASGVNDGTCNLTLVGNRDGRTVVWGKVEEPDNAASPWYYYGPDEYNRKTLPYLDGVRATAYDGGILATGGDFSTVYFSPDAGLTWTASTAYALPDGFGYEAAHFTLCTDDNNIMYITKDGSGEVWSGRLARLGWKQEDTVFDR